MKSFFRSEVFYYKKGENFAVNFKTLDSKEEKNVILGHISSESFLLVSWGNYKEKIIIKKGTAKNY